MVEANRRAALLAIFLERAETFLVPDDEFSFSNKNSWNISHGRRDGHVRRHAEHSIISVLYDEFSFRRSGVVYLKS